MTSKIENYDEPPYWWQDDGVGSDVLKKAWRLVEDMIDLGVEAKVVLHKPQQPTITIALDWDEPDDDVLEEE